MIVVLRPGLLTTVQDLGREGRRHLGVPAAGAADAPALELANRLVGNPPSAAGLEITLAGPRLRAESACAVALLGAPMEAACDGQPLSAGRAVVLAAGATLDLRRVLRGARAYLAVAGGIDVPVVMGSRSTDLRGGFGGLDGRALRAGDRLPVGAARAPLSAAWRRLRGGGSSAALGWWVRPVEDLPAGPALLRVLPGAQAGTLAGGLAALEDAGWSVGADSDRMGLRLDGPALRVAAGEQVSAPVLPGTVQVPADGRPVLLGVDAQTVGGYPVVAHVIRADLGRAMQLRAGDRLRLRVVPEAEAWAAWGALRRALAERASAIAARVAEE